MALGEDPFRSSSDDEYPCAVAAVLKAGHRCGRMLIGSSMGIRQNILCRVSRVHP
jgi:hypothetical protein